MKRTRNFVRFFVDPTYILEGLRPQLPSRAFVSGCTAANFGVPVRLSKQQRATGELSACRKYPLKMQVYSVDGARQAE